MANMSHCRFSNTCLDLQDCIDWLSENDWTELSAQEQHAFRRIVRNCVIVAADYGDDILQGGN